MSAGVNTASTDNQAQAETSRHPIQDYADAGQSVVHTIAERGATHGDPEVFAQTFADFLNTYLRPLVSSGRPLTPADAFVVLDLMKVARIATGGPAPDHFRDMAGYGLLGLVHVVRVTERHALEAKQREERDNAPLEPAPTPEEVARAATRADLLDDDNEGDIVDDVDLLRFALDPKLDPFADLRDEGAFDPASGDGLRPGVTLAGIEARRTRIVSLLRRAAGNGPTTAPDVAEALARYSEPMTKANPLA
jgi:hypothetical protein